MSRRAKNWILILAVPLLSLGAFELWLWSVIGAQERRMQARLVELEVERTAERRTRPVLRGDPLPGNAWDDYHLAIRVPRKPLQIPARIYDDLKDLARKLPQEMVDWATADGGALETLRQGTRRASAQARLEFDRRFTPSVDVLDGGAMRTRPTQVDALPIAAVVRARSLHHEGKSQEAMELLLDLCQFGRDTFDDTSWDSQNTGLWVFILITREIRQVLSATPLSNDALQTLDRELEILDNAWPDTLPTLRNHLIALGKGLEQEVISNSLMYQDWKSRELRSWRWLYSSRLRAVATFQEGDAWYRFQQQSPRDPTLAPAPLWAWPDSVLSDAMDNARLRYRLRVRTQLRICRIGARFLLTGDVLELRTEAEAPIQTLRTGEQLEIGDMKELEDGLGLRVGR